MAFHFFRGQMISVRRIKGNGSALTFPSVVPHRVTPVKSGVRRSLVAWACGPALR
jgi:predicted 2-oxoglutarate/Fe(II)-dependent dioxygenase YbiX